MLCICVEVNHRTTQQAAAFPLPCPSLALYPTAFPHRLSPFLLPLAACCQDLVRQLLVRDPSKRLGCDVMGGYAQIKMHPFFAGVDWETLATQTPPKLEAFLPAMNPGEKGIHETDVCCART